MGKMEEQFKKKRIRTKKKMFEEKKKLENSFHSKAVWSLAAKTASLILFYYVTSIGLTFYQNWLLKKIYFPLSIVLAHFVIKFCLASLFRKVYTSYTGLERITIGWSDYVTRVAIVAVVASLDIGLSQWSFEYIQVALYTITKSSAIVFILFFAILFNLEKKHWSLILIVLMIATGLVMFTYESTDFSLVGFAMVLSASFLSGIRWTVSQLIMQKSSLGLSNPVDMVFHVQPVMIVTLLPFAVGFEGVSLSSSVVGFRYSSSSLLWETLSLVAGGGVLAFLMEMSEYLLVSFTSSLTLSVAGIVKEIISLALAVKIQENDLSIINWIGLVVCMSGIVAHVLRKATTVEAGTQTRSGYRSRKEAGAGDISVPLLSSDSDSSDEIYHVTGLRTRSSATADDPVLHDHRQWTRVRDDHIRAGMEDDDSLKIGMDDNKNSISALEEADDLIGQLDLVSSD